LLFYFIATLYYPGGSQLSKNSKGFSWTQNYWCNLLNENAINGLHNPARPIALTAMVILCLTLSLFWYIFPLQVEFSKRTRFIIQFSGLTGMATGLFLFTSLHDIIINVATAFGLIALVGTLVGLKKLKCTRLLWMGLFIFVLIGLNNLLYYGDGLLTHLPVVQKISFLYFLVWICCINLRLNNKAVLGNIDTQRIKQPLTQTL
jgi:hypothetical protein